MTGYTVDRAALAATIATLRQEAKHMCADIDRLDLEVAALRGGWSGEAQEAYDLAQAQWLHGMREVDGVLSQLVQACEAALEAYTQAYRAMNAGMP
ncbi:MAG: WXG100 family type VII secretion target [Micrococcales bacterium]|nr:WXG100 family type VII secretion target [Micrococcales bacterium]